MWQKVRITNVKFYASVVFYVKGIAIFTNSLYFQFKKKRVRAQKHCEFIKAWLCKLYNLVSFKWKLLLL